MESPVQSAYLSDFHFKNLQHVTQKSIKIKVSLVIERHSTSKCPKLTTEIHSHQLGHMRKKKKMKPQSLQFSYQFYG